MTKAELSEILHEVSNYVNEGIASDKNMNKFPRIIFYPYIEQDGVASGEEYYNDATYQIDIFARIPQCQEYKKLRKILREKGIHPVFYHEYIEKDPIFAKTWHTYFEVEVTEELTDE